MQTTKQARHSNFQRGSGVYACRVCGHRTRDTGDNGQCMLCPICYDLSGIENHQSDNGSLGEYMQTASELMASLALQTSPEKAVACFPSINTELLAAQSLVANIKAQLDALPKDGSPAPEQTRTERAQQNEVDLGNVGYLVHVTGTDHDELILVDAPAARFARRAAKQQYREAGLDVTLFTFNARKA